MIGTLYQKIKIDEKSLRPSAIYRLRFFATLFLIAIPAFALVKFTSLLSGLGNSFEMAVNILFIGSLIPLAFSRMANMMIFTDKRLDEWEIRVKKRAEAFGYRCLLFSIMGMFLALALLIKNEALATRDFTYLEVLFLPALIYFYMVALPIAYVAWTQKPLDDGEDVESLSDWVI